MDSCQIQAAFWGKLRLDSDKSVCNRHPLFAHSADVSAVFYELCQAPLIKSRLQCAAGAELPEYQLSRLAVLAALHDLGKLTWGFQNKAPDAGGKETCGHIQCLAGLASARHQAVALEVLGPICAWFANELDFTVYLYACFSHHGAPVSPFENSSQRIDNAKWWSPRNGLVPLDGMRALLEACRIWYPAAFASGLAPMPKSAMLSHLFAGLVSLADWLGSDERLFPYCGEKERPQSGDPMPYARKAARQALLDTGLLPRDQTRHGGAPPSFERQFGLTTPRPLQQAIQEIPLDQAGLTILEAETGSGKTEAAWLHFMRLYCQGLVDGIYFANPLRLAATQIHQRLTEYARNSFAGQSPGVVLAVPGYLRVDEATGYRLPGYQVLWDDDQSAGRQARYWAAESPKRFLCSAISAGTIDQALMAGLRVKHSPMRAAAISRSLLVVDEVHASDNYMTRLTENLLRLFKQTGGQVLLMSATLGGETRERFLACMGDQRGPQDTRLSLQSARETVYPLISQTRAQSPIKDYQSGAGKQKAVRIRLAPCITAPDRVAEMAAQAARNGAAVLVLRNTVRQAVATAQALEELLQDEPGLLFRPAGKGSAHHSRYAGVDRKLLDDYLIGKYGKEAAKIGRRSAGVVTATQTVEQSLDLDFDLLITDLCPMDVLLQRIGRLHRHEDNQRPSGYRQALCLALTPDTGPAWLVNGEARRFSIGPRLAYEDPRAVAATWQKLQGFDQSDAPVLIPRMNRELVEDSLHSEVLAAVEKELGDEWNKIRRELQGIHLNQNQLARGHAIDWRKPYGPESAAVMGDDKVQTRLGLGDRVVEWDQAIISPFGQELKQLNIPGWMLEGAPAELAFEPLEIDPGRSLRFRLKAARYDKVFVYNRFGLEFGGNEDENQPVD